jgi:uncharacterized protein
MTEPTSEPTLTPAQAPKPERPQADYPGCPVTVTEALAAGAILRPPRWGIPDAVIGAVGYLVIALLVTGVLYALGAPDDVVIILGTTVPWLALAGWPLLAAVRRGNGPRIDFGFRLTWPDAGWAAMGAAVGLFAAGVAALVTTLFVDDLSSSAGEAAQELVDSSSRPALVGFALIIMVGGPVVEEIFFRGLLFGSLRKRGVNSVWTIVITAVIFAGFHFEPTRLLILLPTGLVLGWVRWKTGTTGASMLAHGLINAPGAIVLLYGIPSLPT